MLQQQQLELLSVRNVKNSFYGIRGLTRKFNYRYDKNIPKRCFCTNDKLY